MKLLVGLGNPGRKYEKTRHNTGFHVIDRLAAKLNVQVEKSFFRARVGQALVAGEKVLLAKPQTYMNASGRAVAPLLHWYKLSLDNLLVIYDDLDLPPGTLRIRPKGGSGGHRGMASVIEQLGSEDFARLKIGVGKPGPHQGDTVDWVLGKFSPEEKREMVSVVDRAADAVYSFVVDGLNQAMNRFNC